MDSTPPSTEIKPLILLVDDEPANVYPLGVALSAEYRVVVAGSGEEALAMLARDPRPDLVLLDAMMPGMDGYEVCRRIKSDPNSDEIPVLFITAMSEPEDEARGLRLGAIDYISKPFNVALVLARVRNHLHLKRRADLLRSLTKIDPVTYLPTRSGFDDLFEREWWRAERNRESIALLLARIDRFEQLNRENGHGTGDHCLRAVARAVAAAAARPGDAAARFGPYEFALLLPETDLMSARLRAEALRAQVEALALRDVAVPAGHLTVSVGLGATTPRRGTDPSELLDCVQELLSTAARQGNATAGRSCG